MDITEESIEATARNLNMTVWLQATNPASRPVISGMAYAVLERDWAALLVLAEALEKLEALTSGITVRLTGTRAAEFARRAMRDAAGAVDTRTYDERREDGEGIAVCPECGSAEWDFNEFGKAQCRNDHAWDQAPDIPGTFVRPGYPGDINDPERYPDGGDIYPECEHAPACLLADGSSTPCGQSDDCE